MKENFCIILSTFPDEKEAKKISEILLQKKLIACVNIVPKILSMYFWDGKLTEDSEVLAIIKSEFKNFEEIKTTIEKNHSYQIPEIICLEIKAGNQKYFDWISNVVNFKNSKNVCN